MFVQFGRSMWHVFGGRKDGRVSLATEATRDLPSGGANYTTLRDQFAGLGLNYIDLVALSGTQLSYIFSDVSLKPGLLQTLVHLQYQVP